MSGGVTRAYVPDGAVLRRYFESRSRVQIIQGPVGSGTSSASLHKLHKMSFLQAPDYDGVRRTRWVILRDTYPNLRNSTIKTYLDWFPDGGEFGEIVYNPPPKVTFRARMPDGSKVESERIFLALGDLNEAERLLPSWEFTGAFYNELQNCHDKGIVDKVLDRLDRYPSLKNGPGATWSGFLGDMNSPYENHWLPMMRQAEGDPPPPDTADEQILTQYRAPENWEFFIQPPGMLETTVDGIKFYQANPDAENQKWLKPGYYENKRGELSDADFQASVMNRVRPLRSGRAVYPHFSVDDHCLKFERKPDPNLVIHVGLDGGRSPAACFGQRQIVDGLPQWVVFSELIGANESAELFAPRVRDHCDRFYPGMALRFTGDPRMDDGTQATESTAFMIYERHRITVHKAPGENDPLLRNSTMEQALNRRHGFFLNPRCRMLRQGMAGGYHFRRNATTGVYSTKPEKNEYSHVVEACENMLLGGGENAAVGHQSHKAPQKVRRTPPRLGRMR